MAHEPFTVQLSLRDGFAFDVDFGWPGVPRLVVDVPPPLGSGTGPNAARLLAAGVGHCLAASLLFCLHKSRIEVGALRTTVRGSMERNTAGRLRIPQLRVRLEPEVAPGEEDRLRRCLELFEDYCTVTESVRQGMSVEVEVIPAGGARLHSASAAESPRVGAILSRPVLGRVPSRFRRSEG